MSSEQDAQDRMRQFDRRLTALENRVSDLESNSTSETLDRYDATVLDMLDEGETYSLASLREKYRRAGVKNTSKLKNRIRHLTKSYCQQIDHQQWRFVGGDESGT